ncbi:MAG: hypothetical protein V1746_00415 [bacterium]
MSLWATYREARRAAKEHKTWEMKQEVEANRTPNHLRIDVSPTAISVATVAMNAFRFVHAYPADGYESSLSKATHEIAASQFLKPGFSAVFTLWPEMVKHDIIPVGSDQLFSSAKAIDLKMQSSPESLHLDANYAYRVIGVSKLKADCVGIKLGAWRGIQDALPLGVDAACYWGPLAALEALVERFHSIFADEQIVVGMIDAARVYYFKLYNAEVTGVDISRRAALRDTKDLKDVLRVFEALPETKIYFISLTSDAADADALCMEASTKEGMRMHLVERKHLVQSFKMLQAAEPSPFFPLALVHGGKHGEF